MSLIVESSEKYNLRHGLRASVIKELLKSPAHARVLMTAPPEPTPAMVLGTAVHTAILEPDQFEKYIVSPRFDKRTKDGKAAAADFEASNPGRILIDEDKYEILKGCLNSVYTHRAAKAETTGRCEMTVIWDEADLKCKARPDIMREGILVDVKTTQDASPAGFSRQVANLKYHVQAYHYLRGVTQATGILHDCFRIVAVETKAPYAVAVYELDFGTMEKAEALWRHATDMYRQCAHLNEWPGYSQEVQPLGLPAWAFNEADGGAE